MAHVSRCVAFAIGLGIVTLPAPAVAQLLGNLLSSRWQLQPYCNVLTVTVRTQGPVYTFDGHDDQCDAAPRSSVVGTAVFNQDGSVGIGFTTVLAPGGGFVHVSARINAVTLRGPWHDSAGNGGTFVPLLLLTPGTGGPLRPVPPNSIPLGSITAEQLAPHSITSTQIAPGAIGAAELAPGSVNAVHINSSQVQGRVSGTCPPGEFMRGINADGSVACGPLVTIALSTNVDEPANRVGFFTSIAIGADGLPIISHGDGDADALRVTHCGNPACSADNVSTTVDDPANDVGTDSSLAIGADGLPVISHWDFTAKALRVTHCGNATCTAGNISTTVDDPANAVGRYTSLAIGADGLPVISYHDETAGALRVTHCGNAACTSGNVSTTVDAPANTVGVFTSIAIGADGLPVISHFDASALALRVTHCGNAACTAGNVSTTVADELSTVGFDPSIAIGADGLPVISHGSGDDLLVTHCGDAACTAGNLTTIVDAPPSAAVGGTSAIAIGADGLPVIAHTAAPPNSLRVTHCGNAACTSGTISTTVDDPAHAVGSMAGIAIGVDGLPVISHHDGRSGALRVTKCATRTCQ